MDSPTFDAPATDSLATAEISVGRVYIVDDDAGMRRSLAFVIESAGLAVEAFASGEEFLSAYSDRQPAVLILDLLMPGLLGQELLDTLRGRGLQFPVIVLTGHGDVPAAVRTLKAGAMDFLEKPADPDFLLERVREALAADAVRRRRQVESAAAAERFAALTPRERQLLDLLVEGKSNKDIAAALSISVKTVAHHRAHLMAKVRAVNAADLVRLRFEAGQE